MSKAQLFLMPTHVAGSVDKLGRARAGHMASRFKRIGQPVTQDRVESSLDKFIASHGGPDRMRESLGSMTPEQRAKLIDAMSYVGNVSHDAVLDKLGMKDPPRDPAKERQALVDRLGRGVAGGFINETESAQILDTYDEKGSDVALDTLRGILRQKKEAAASAQSPAAAPPPAEPAAPAEAEPPAETGPQEGDTKTEDGVEYVLREGRWHRTTPEETPAAPAAAAEEPAPEPEVIEGDDLDPNSPNYRYRDTGYVGGSRKEEAVLMIRRAAKTGQRVRVTDIDWAELEQNPRQAAEMIVKENIFGEVDWQAMRDAGIEPGAGFLIQKAYAAVAPAPAIDSELGRKDYALGIDSIRNRLEACKTVEDVTKTLDEIRDERDGIILTAEEATEYNELSAAVRAEFDIIHETDRQADELYKRAIHAQSSASKMKFDLEKRGIRKWKIDPEMQQASIAATAEAERLMAEWHQFRENAGMQGITNRTTTATGISVRTEYPYRRKADELSRRKGAIISGAKARNVIENPLTRAWNSLGESFNNIVDYRSHKGSDAFRKHWASAKAGRVKDWSWAEKKAEPRKATKRSVAFQLLVADKFEREGGRKINVDSTATLKEHFNLREVQSGNWVLDDVNAAKAHVENCANAFADMSDILGIPDGQISFNGRLAMAFGARGRGNAGGATAKAHYDPVHRIINITKMEGGGSVAHEWFHMVDNLMKESTTGTASAAEDFVSENSALLDDDELKGAFREVTNAMMSGPHRKTVTIQYTETEEKLSKVNMERRGSMQEAIHRANGVQAALDAIDAIYQRGALGKVDSGRARKQRDTWKTIAAIHHGGNASREVTYETGPGMSMFALEATHLDRGVAGKYWSTAHEMAARAFSGFMQDKLEAAGRRNTYLVSMADNAAYKALGLPSRPFPEGEERERINVAFEKLFTLLRERNILAKALGWAA